MITMGGYELENATQNKLSRTHNSKILEAVRSMFGNFVIQTTNRRILQRMNKALNNVVQMLIPGANVKNNFTDTLSANAEKSEKFQKNPELL